MSVTFGKAYATSALLKVVVSLVIGFVIGLLMQSDFQTICEYNLLVIAIINFALGFFAYLNRDNFSASRFSHGRYATNIFNKVGLDFIAEDSSKALVVSRVEMISYIISGIILLLPSIFFMLFG